MLNLNWTLDFICELYCFTIHDFSFFCATQNFCKAVFLTKWIYVFNFNKVDLFLAHEKTAQKYQSVAVRCVLPLEKELADNVTQNIEK